MTTPSQTPEAAGLSETYRFAYDSIRNGAPGLSDATCAAIARSINMKVSLAANDRATAAEARADGLAKVLETLEAERKREGVNLAHLKRAVAVAYADMNRAALQQETQP